MSLLTLGGGFLGAPCIFFAYDYEHLLLRHRVAHLSAIFGFIFGPLPLGMAERAFGEYELGSPPLAFSLHPSTCSSRVDNWQALRQMLNGTRTQLLCDRLEIRFGEAERAKRDLLGKRLVHRASSHDQIDAAAQTAARAIDWARTYGCRSCGI